MNYRDYKEIGCKVLLSNNHTLIGRLTILEAIKTEVQNRILRSLKSFNISGHVHRPCTTYKHIVRSLPVLDNIFELSNLF